MEKKIISRSSLMIASIFFVFLIISWIVYIIFSVSSRNFNWINKYFESLELIAENEGNENASVRRGRVPFRGVFTIIEHPDLMLPHELKDFYGWNTRNGFFVHIDDPESKGNYLKLSQEDNLWVGSDAINVDIPLCRCDKKDALTVYCLVVDDGKIYRRKQGENYLFSLALKHSHITDNGKHRVLNEHFKNDITNIIGYNKINIGILSLFRKNGKDGLLVLVSVNNPDEQYLEIGMKQNRDIAKYIVEKDSTNEFDCIEAYALLTYMLSTDKRIDFAKCFNDSVKKKYQTDNRKIVYITNDDRLIDVSDEQNSFISRLIVLKKDTFQFIKDNVIGNTSTKIFAIFSYLLFSILMPYLEEKGKLDLNDIFSINKNEILYIFVLFLILWIYVLIKYIYNAIHKLSKKSHRKLHSKILSNYIALPEDKHGRLLEPTDYRNVNITFVDEVYGDYEQLDSYKSTKLLNEINDGKKYRLIDYKQKKDDSYDLVVDLCHYTQCKALHLIGDAKNNYKKKPDERIPGNDIEGAKKLYKKYKEAALSFTRNGKIDDIALLPPNNLCLHMIIVTEDGKVLVSKRDKNLSYENNKLDFSIEEQLSSKDFCKDGKIVEVWVKRALEEELGLTRYNALRDDYFEMEISSLFLEERYLNYSLCGIVKLKISSEKLKAILDGWPRSDYEFDYQIVSIDQFSKYIINLANNIKDQNKLRRIVEKWHSSSFNRMYQFSIYYGLDEMQEACDIIINNVETKKN